MLSYSCSIDPALPVSDVSCRWHRCQSLGVCRWRCAMCESRALFLASLTRLVCGLEPDAMTADHAKELVSWFSRVEHLAAAGKMLCAGRVAATGAFSGSGAASAASWLAGETGGFVTDAMKELETESQLRQLPVLEEAFRSGELSP